MDSELLVHLRQRNLCSSSPVLQSFHHLLVNSFSFIQYFIVEFKLLLVKCVNGFHVFHTLLKDLHLSFELDFLFILLVSILAHDVFKLLGVLFLIVLALCQVGVLEFTMFLEKTFNFICVTSKNVSSFIFKFRFNCLQLCVVVLTHSLVLVLHILD